jgi:hypothetical protein
MGIGPIAYFFLGALAPERQVSDMEGDGMKQLVGLVILLVGAAVLLGSCGTQRIGEMQRESQSVDLENAQSVETN